MDLLPLRAAFDVRSPRADLQTLLRLGGRVQRLDLRAFQVHEHLFFHVLVEHARGRRQIHLNDVHDRLFEVEPVCSVDCDTHVAQCFLNLLLRLIGRLDAESGMRSPEPTLLEGVVGAAQPVALIHEPHLPPKVLKAVRTGSTR
ncbi:hypothetical protein D3C76_1336580 [compost metagenome]